MAALYHAPRDDGDDGDDRDDSRMDSARPPGRQDAIWYKDVAAFLDASRLLDFWPSPHMSIEERINATCRFILYASVLLFATTRRFKYLVFGGLLVLALSLVYERSDRGGAQPGRGGAAEPPAWAPGRAGNASSGPGASAPPMVRDYIKFANFLSK
jgi:hypothetical protein